MALKLEDQSILLQFGVWACVATFLVCFLTALYANLLVISKTGALINRNEDRTLSWSERAGRKSSRFNKFLVADEFRSLRRLCFGAWTGAALSFGVLFLLVVLFGEPTNAAL